MVLVLIQYNISRVEYMLGGDVMNNVRVQSQNTTFG